MTSSIRKSVWAAVYLVAGAVVWGCASESAPFDPKLIERPYRAHASEVESMPLPALPTTIESPYASSTTQPSATRNPTTAEVFGHQQVVRLSLQDAIRLAMANSFAIKVSGYEPAIDKTRIEEARGQFDPVFTLSGQRAIQDHPTPGEEFFVPGQAGAARLSFFDDSTIDTFKAEIKQNLESGGQVSLSYQAQQNNLRPQRFVLNPYWTSEFVLQVNQPLLRNFGRDANLARITIAQNTAKVTALQFRLDVEKQLADLEEAYWQLVLAEQSVKVQESLLGRTHDTQTILGKRTGQDVTRVQLRQAEAALRVRETTLAEARAEVERQSNKVKQLMNDPDMPVSGGILLLPADEPLQEPVILNTNEHINTALSNRAEVLQQLLKIDSATVVEKASKINLLPQLDLVFSTGFQGLAHDYAGAWDSAGRFGFIDYTIGLQLTIPIGNREARAIWTRSRLQRLQSITQYKNIIEQVELDVRNAEIDVRTAWSQLALTRRARMAAADALLGLEQQEPHLQVLSPEFVQLKLQQQDQLAEAERSEVSATTRYNIALYTLERAKGTLLPYNNVHLDESPDVMR